jgi:hypothetical protein
MQITPELKRVLEGIEPNFFGSIEIGVQGGIPGTAKVITTLRLTSRDNRETNGDRNSQSR